MLRRVVRCPMCGEAVWTDRSKCGSCGVRIGWDGTRSGGRPSPAPDRDGRGSWDVPPGPKFDSSSGRIPRIPAAIVGRDPVLDRVMRHVGERLAGGRGAAVMIHGPAGSGKSALLAAAVARGPGPGTPAARIEVRLGRGAREPLAPIERLVVRWMAEGSADWRDLATLPRRLARRIRDVGPTLGEVEAREIEIRLAALAGLRGVAAPRDEEQVLRKPTPFLEALAHALRLDAARRPLVIGLDGLEHGTDDGRFLLSQVARRLADAPIAWLAAARSIDAASLFTGAFDVDIVALGPLAGDDFAVLLSEYLAAPVSRELGSLVQRMSQGYPGPAIDALRSLEQSGAIRRTAAGCDVGPAATARRLGPQTLEALIGVRWEGLGTPVREILEDASVLGEVVWDEAIAALERSRRSSAPPESGFEARQVEDLDAARAHLAELVRLGFLGELDEAEFDGAREYAFALDDLRAFVYGTVPAELRARLHLAAGRWLSVRAAGRPNFAESIARHLHAAGNVAEAARLYGEAAAEARRRTLLDRAVWLFGRRLDLLDPADLPERLSTLHDLGTVEMSMGRYAAAASSFRSMLEIAWSVGVPGKVAVALSKMGRVHRVRGDYAAAIREIDEALRLFRSCGDMAGVAGTLADLGSLRYLLGEYAEARRCNREALSIRRELEDDRGTAVALLQLAVLDRADGLLSRAATKAQEALRLGEGSSAPEELAQAMNVLGVVACDQGQDDVAIGYLQEGLRLAQGVDRRVETYVLNNLGEVHFRARRFAEASEALKRALELASEDEDLRALGEIQHNISRLAVAEGKAAKAVEYADRAAELAGRIGSAESKALAYLAVAEARAAAGQGGGRGADPPEAFFLRAVEILRSIGHKVELARALGAHARFLQAAGRAAEAAPLEAEAAALSPEQGTPPSSGTPLDA